MNQSETGELGALRQEVGKIIGTLEEITNSTRENSKKIDDLANVVSRQDECVRRTDLLEQGHSSQGARLDALERTNHRRDGAVGLVSWFAKNWPVAAIISALTAVVAWANGKI